MNNSYSSDSSSFGQAYSPAGDRGGRSSSRGPASRGPRSSSRSAMPRMEKGGNQLERPKGSVYQYGKFRYLGDEASSAPVQPRKVSINPADYGYVPRNAGARSAGPRGGTPEFTVSSSAKFARRPGAPSARPMAPRSANSFNFKDGYDNRGGYNAEFGDRGPSREESIASPRPSRGGYGNRPSFGPSRGGFGPSRGPARGGFGSRGPARGGRKGREESINPSMFINRAAPEKLDADGNVIAPIDLHPIKHTFMDFALDDKLKRSIVAKGYVTPSPIQDQAIPLILEGRDIVGIANTGTGKTAAFLLPLIEKVIKNKTEQILIVAPTRELAIQIDQEFKDLTKGSGFYSVCCVGGVNIVGQLKELRFFNNFIIGTPGRLKDLIERGQIKLEKFNTIVLDEADQMLDMGFINDMKYLVEKMPAVRHTLFFSATLSPEIERLIGSFLNNPARVMVKTRDTSKDVEQDVVRIQHGMHKADVLRDMLKQPEFDKVIVFCKTKHGAEKLSNFLIKEGIKAESIHGDKDHRRRQKALGLFKQDHVNVLVATDVAARGLDISGVSHVINFDLPSTYTDYVHRIGRTGRAGKKGIALTFIQG
jgi:ATP-dependent RNA helicase RhlE